MRRRYLASSFDPSPPIKKGDVCVVQETGVALCGYLCLQFLFQLPELVEVGSCQLTATDLIRLAADQNFSDCCFDFSEQLGGADVTVELFALFTHVVPPISSSRFA